MKWLKRIRYIVSGLFFVAIVICIGLVLNFLFGRSVRKTDDITYYRVLSGEQEGSDMIPVMGEEFDMYCPFHLPQMKELEPYEDYRFDYTATRMAFFQSHAYILIVSYDTETYLHKKAQLEQDYTYLTDTFQGEKETEYHQPHFDLDGFHFRAVQAGQRDYADVKCIFFTGTSDDRNEIAFIYFHDQDLDFISPDLATFVVENTGWKRVRQ